MKLLFLTPYELENVVEEVLEEEKEEPVYCQADYSEEQQTDIIRITSHQGSQEIPVTRFIEQLNQYFGVNILHYDVFEVGDLGEGFVFEIQ